MFFSGSNYGLIASQELLKDKSTNIPLDYLNQLPTNDYIIGPGDSINIIISRDLDLFSNASVDGEGTINIPKLERVYVNGLTIAELKSLLNEAYKKFIKFPEVEIIITQYRPIKVFVEGEIVNPGLQTLEGSLALPLINKEKSNLSINNKGESNLNNKGESNLNIFEGNKESLIRNNNYYFPTVFDAIRASGGITQFSDLKEIQVIRNDSISNGSGKITTTLNFEDLLRFGENNQNIRIYDSDIIKVPKSNKSNKSLLTKAILSDLNPRYISVFVSGRVNRPGDQRLSRASVLSDAIDMAGGAKILRGPVTFIRFESNGSIDKRKLKLTKKSRGKYNNPNLRDGDLIIVGDSVMSTTNEVITEFTSPFVGIFSTYGLIRAIAN